MEPNKGMGRDKRPGRNLSDEERRERARIQLGIITAALGEENVGWDGDGSDDPADFAYLYHRGYILIRDADVDRVRQHVDGEPVQDLIDGLTLFRLAGNQDTLDVVQRIDRVLGVGVATPDHILHVSPRTGSACPATEPEEPTSKDPIPAVSTNSFDGTGVMVSVVDTGWHPPAARNRLTPWLKGVDGDREANNPRTLLRPYAGHGTFIAGIVRCVAPRSEVRVEGFLPNGGAIYESQMVIQLNQALALGPDIISLSAGSYTRRGRALLSFEVFWETRLRHVKGTVLVAAAGNDSDRVPFWPAAFPWSVSVGATNPDRTRADFSNYGSWVDVYALGTDLVNAFPKGRYETHEPPVVGELRTFDGLAQWSGTSFSTPLVAGMIAARMSARGESARVAADALLQRARDQAIPGVGPILEPGPQNQE